MQPLQPLAMPCDGVRLIEASAGTGKTYTIATLYLRLLLEQARNVTELLVVTFTEAATEELRDRVRGRLREALALLQGGASDDPLLTALIARLPDHGQSAEHLTQQLTRIDEAAIFTIHGFCQRMLQENAFESGTLFDTEFITDESELLNQVVEDFWRRTFYPDPGLAELAAATWGTPAGLAGAIRSYIGRRDLRIEPGFAEAQYGRAAWTAALGTMLQLWGEQRAAIIDRIETDKNLSRGPYKSAELTAAADALDSFIAGDTRDYQLPDRFELFTTSHLAGAVTPAKRAKGIGPPEHPFFDACQTLQEIHDRKALQLLVAAIDFSREQLARRKQQLGWVSFDDLLSNLADALHGPGGAELAERIAGRFPVALIDEFQDTDPEQFRIFSRIYREREGCGLFMIGDPKQAIYSFRGADVFTYMAAKEGTHPDRDRFTLATNWRSAQRLVDGVNALFAGHAPFIYQGHIDFHPVAAAGKADQAPLTVDGEPPVPLQAWFVAREPDNVDHRGKGEPDLSKPIKKGWASERLSAACAEQVVELLLAGAGGRVRIGGRALEPRDIAILVRNRFEAEAVQQALRARGVASAYYSRDSVFESEQAADLLRILTAVAEPDEERTLRSALCTGLLGAIAAELDQLSRDELAWEGLLEEFHRYHRLWLERGFMAMFRRLLHDRGIPYRLLSLADGERRLTNLLQLAELTQNASREHHGIENQLRWFAEQCAAPNGDAEEQQLRLESDADLVKIVTIHKSKGLEYPVVFLPFLWSTRAIDGKRPPLFHAESGERSLTLDLTGSAEHVALADKERLAEELRLVYVALTRAQYLCYFAWGQFKEAAGSALAWLLHAEPGLGDPAAVAERVRGLDDAELRERLVARAATAPGSLAVTGLPSSTARLYSPTRTESEQLTARTPGRRLTQGWHVASFTGLASGRFEPVERPDHGSAGEDRAADSRASAPDIFRFPKGARAGTFMHQLFEAIDFPAASGEMLQTAVSLQLSRHGYESDWQPVIEQLVSDVLDTPLDGDNDLALRRVTRERRLIELEFHYPLAELRPESLNALLPGLGGFDADTPRLRFNPVAGVMRGFIDLVFEHNGRYYIADYKSSYLGERVEEYGPSALGRAVAQHRYDLQYLIYTVALHRYLRHRIAGYAYERHFGGIYYLFVRGMRPALGTDYGVWFDRPEQAQVDALDKLFAGEAARQ